MNKSFFLLILRRKKYILKLKGNQLFVLLTKNLKM